MVHKPPLAERRRDALFVLPMALIAVLLVALPLIYVLGTSLAPAGTAPGSGASAMRSVPEATTSVPSASAT